MILVSLIVAVNVCMSVNSFTCHLNFVSNLNILYETNFNRDLNDDGDSNNKSEMDWRAFRARLVRSEDNIIERATTEPINEKHVHWAFDSGDLVERGSIVISLPSSDPSANDFDSLNNQCFRKSVVLVLDVQPNFIQGIILNRPTEIDIIEGMKFVWRDYGKGHGSEIANSSHRWKVWFGGEVGGPFSDYGAQVVCLHSVMSDLALGVSEVVLPGVLLTSFDGAEFIVQAGDATPSDFWLFCGMCGWETTSFYREMHEEGLWRVVSSDGATIIEDLNLQRCDESDEQAARENCDIDSDSRNAGLHTWEMLMGMIGGYNEMHEKDKFGDLMLRQWATDTLSFSTEQSLSSTVQACPAGAERIMDSADKDYFDIAEYDPARSMSSIAGVDNSDEQSQSNNAVGRLIRASSATMSPFLLSDQGYHKSLILILLDDDDCSVGVQLNHITGRSLILDLGYERNIHFTLRYGGPSGVDAPGDEVEISPITFLYCNTNESISILGNQISGNILLCSKEEVIHIVKTGLASPDEFMVIEGLSIWRKQSNGTKGGVLGDIQDGIFEDVSMEKVNSVWGTLLSQTPLSHNTLEHNLALSKKAWRQARSSNTGSSIEGDNFLVLSGDSNEDIESLADEALRRWIKVNLADADADAQSER